MLKSKLNGGNLIKAINTFAVSTVRYTAGIFQWNQEELQTLDRMTRKLLTMHGALHPKSDVDRLYVERGKGGRGLMSIEEVVKDEERSLQSYTNASAEVVMQAASEVIKFRYGDASKKDRYGAWSEKAMHGQFLQQTQGIRSEAESWLWLKRGFLKRETESLVAAAQDQALRTNYRRANIEKDGTSPTCRMCHQGYETVSHIVAECSKLAQNDYKARHDKVATAVHWCLSKKYGLHHSEKWYHHRAEAVCENDDAKLYWDFNVYTDRVIEARRPDIILLKKKENECLVIDIAVPGDARVQSKEEEKSEKYQELCREIQKLWRVKCKVIPVVIGALGTIPLRLSAYLGLLDIDLSIETVQQSVILGTARILRKVLDM